jgi:hypothetical protein
VAVAALPGLASASYASFGQSTGSLTPPAPVAQAGGYQPAPPAGGYQQSQPVGNQGNVPQQIDRGMDGWFLDRIFGRR